MSRKFALLINNSEYEDESLAQLQTPEADAQSLADVLRNPEIGAFDEVTLVSNQSSQAIREAIVQFFDKKKRDDLLLLYFSGHGIVDRDGRLYLAAPNTRKETLRASGISAKFVTEEMDRCRSRRELLVLDCCHSGAFASGSKGAAMSVGTASAFEGDGYGRIVLTATDATQYAWEGTTVSGSAPRSVFTNYLVEGLESGGADLNGSGTITVDELYDYAYSRVLDAASDEKPQTPGKWTYKEQGNLVIANNIKGIREIESIIDSADSTHPTELPPGVEAAVNSSQATIRLGIIRTLFRMLNGDNQHHAAYARTALETLADDEGLSVSRTARKVLGLPVEDDPELPVWDGVDSAETNPIIPSSATIAPDPIPQPTTTPAGSTTVTTADTSVPPAVLPTPPVSTIERPKWLLPLIGIVVLMGMAFAAYTLISGPPSAGGGTLIAFQSKENRNTKWGIYTMDADGNNITQITSEAFDDERPRWSPDGEWIAYQSTDGDKDIYIIRSDGTRQTRITNLPNDEHSPSWSSDGKQLVYHAEANGRAAIFKVSIDIQPQTVRLSEPVQLTNGDDGQNFWPVWSPDDSEIAFWSTRNGAAPAIYKMDADGSNHQLVSRGVSGTLLDPIWSAAQNAIAFYRDDGDRTTLFYRDMVSSDIEEFPIDIAAKNVLSDVSADGIWLLLHTDWHGSNEIYRVRADGERAIRLTNDSANNLHPVWQPAP